MTGKDSNGRVVDALMANHFPGYEELLDFARETASRACLASGGPRTECAFCQTIAAAKSALSAADAEAKR